MQDGRWKIEPPIHITKTGDPSAVRRLLCRQGICLAPHRSAEFYSISIGRNCRRLRRFFVARFSSSSPHDAGVGRGPRRGATPPLPSPLLQPMEERECLVAAPPRCAVSEVHPEVVGVGGKAGFSRLNSALRDGARDLSRRNVSSAQTRPQNPKPPSLTNTRAD